MKRAKVTVGLAASALLVSSGYVAFAQGQYAAVHGTASDSSGAILPDATITILNTSTGLSSTVRADSKGYYIFPQLGIGGPYTVTVQKDGFSDFKSTGLMLNLNDNREVDALMQPAGSTTNVVVEASAVQVETSDTQLKQTFSSTEILDLPLLGRDASMLQKLSPGVVEASDGRGGFATNGNQSFNNSYMLDGNDIDDGPLNTLGLVLNPDAMAQENIITGTAGPQYARNSGATVDQSVKSGTNKFHGSGFEFYRDTFLNDPGYAFGSTSARPPFHQNTYGGTVGGPILKDRVFFFLGYQGIRSGTGSNYSTPVFSSAQRNGDFSGDLANLGGSLSSNPVPFSVGTCTVGPGGGTAAQTWANCLPAAKVATSAYNPISSSLLNTYVPLSNTTISGTPYYTFSNGNAEKYDQGTLRADAKLTSKDQIWASGIFQSSPTANTLSFYGGSLPGFGETNSEHFKLFSASETHAFNSSTLNEIRVNYFRFLYAAVSPQHVVQPSSLGFSNINPQHPSSASIPYIGVTGYFNLGFSQDGPQPRNDQNLKFADTFTKVIGSHNLSIGAFAEKFTVENPFYFDQNGNFSYGGSGTFSSGDAALDFVLGVPDSYYQNSGGFIDARAWEGYAFAGDNWKVSRALTLNLALGYDIETPYQSLQFGGLDVTCWQNSSAQSKVFTGAFPGLLYPGDPGCTNTGATKIQYHHFSPRVGFAWAPSTGPRFLTGAEGSNSFSLRGGFGVYFNRDIEEQALQNLETPPFNKGSQGALDSGYSPSFANPYASVAGDFSGTSPFPFTRPVAGAKVDFTQFTDLQLNSTSATYVVPYVYSFNLNLQRSLPSNMVMSIGYSGSLGRRLALAEEADPITAAGHAACVAEGPTGACYQDRNYQGIYYPTHKTQPATTAGSIDYLTVGQQFSEGASNYNGLLLSLQKAPTHGLFFQLSYTYSHGLDNGSGYESSSGSQGRSYNFIPGFQALNYGDSDYDARHRFTAAYVYEVPLPGNWKNNTLLRTGLGGWEISGISTLQTGFPINVYSSSHNSEWCESYTYYGCPDNPDVLVSKVKSQDVRKTGTWFAASDFADEPIGTFGNSKRNFFHGPGFNYSNLNVVKNFKIDPEGVRRVQLRLEAYNAFNHANFANPANDSFAPNTFGTVSSLRTPSPTNADGDPQPGRSVQLGAKFYF